MAPTAAKANWAGLAGFAATVIVGEAARQAWDMKKFNGKTVLTFDCYGTLIDWETGLWAALEPVLKRRGQSLGREAALALFGPLEAEQEHGPYKTYRQVLGEVLKGIGAKLGFKPSDEEVRAFGGSVGDWPAFADSPDALASLKQRFKLVVITNCDDDLFALSNKKLRVAFDHVITAQQAKSYKPSLNNFHVAFKRIGVPQGEILHVAQSLFHDHVPAKQLGLTSVWINRRRGKAGAGATPPANATPDYEYPDMKSFADAAA
jgi:2-haloacid dehalogenase